MGSVVFRHGRPIAIETLPSTAQPKRARRGAFVKVPLTWIERLKGTKSPSVYVVALHVLHRHWRDNGKPVTVSNKVMRAFGTSSSMKWRALRELETRGLVRVEVSGGRAPRVTVL